MTPGSEQVMQPLLELQAEPEFAISPSGQLLSANALGLSLKKAFGFLENGEVPNYIGQWLHEIPVGRVVEKTVLVDRETWHLRATQSEINGYFFIRFETHQEYRQQLLQQHYDPLTKLPNLLIFKQSVIQALEVIQPLASIQSAILIFDIEQFKDLNIKYGYEMGDQLLKLLAERLLVAIPSKAIVARVSGNEFAVLLQQVANLSEVEGIVAHVEKQIALPFIAKGHRIDLKVRVGMAISDDSTSADVLLGTAHAALNQARIQRKAKQLFCSKLQKVIDREELLIEDFPTALKRGDFTLYYEPRVALKTNQIVGAEALLRWQHPALGMIGPVEFIPLAERTGFIVELGAWVLDSVFNTLKKWQREERGLIEISMNLSALELSSKKLLHRLQYYAEQCPTLLPFLDLEITENMLLEDLSNATDMIQQIHQMGVKLSIDDFGTGYSSLSYLTRLAVDKLKIDQVFLQQLCDDVDNQVIVRTIIQLAKQLEMTVCAEGVETKGQLEFIQKAACDEAQGYYFTRPMPLTDFEQWMILNANASTPQELPA